MGNRAPAHRTTQNLSIYFQGVCPNNSRDCPSKPCAQVLGKQNLLVEAVRFAFFEHYPLVLSPGALPPLDLMILMRDAVDRACVSFHPPGSSRTATAAFSP